MNAKEVTAGLAECNGSLLLCLWRDSLRVTCGLTACTPGSAPGPTLGNEYGKTLPLPFYYTFIIHSAGERIFNIGEHLAELQAKSLTVTHTPLTCTFVLKDADLAR